MKTTLCQISLIVLTAIPLGAQSDPDSGSERETGRLAWFACTSIPDDLDNPVKVMTDGRITELELPRFMTSDPVKIPDDGIIRIVRAVPDPEDPAVMQYLVLAEARIPEGVREALIILMPLAEQLAEPLARPEGDLVFHAMVQDLASFNGGDRLFINLSDTNISVQIGETNVRVPARRSQLFEAPRIEAPTNKPIIFRFYHPERREWKIFSASTIVLRPTRRKINIFNNGSRIGKIEKHQILFPIPIDES